MEITPEEYNLISTELTTLKGRYRELLEENARLLEASSELAVYIENLPHYAESEKGFHKKLRKNLLDIVQALGPYYLERPEGDYLYEYTIERIRLSVLRMVKIMEARRIVYVASHHGRS